MAGMANIRAEPALMNATITLHISPETVPNNGHQRASCRCSIALTVITPKLIHANTMSAMSKEQPAKANGRPNSPDIAPKMRAPIKKDKNNAGIETTHAIVYSTDKGNLVIRATSYRDTIVRYSRRWPAHVKAAQNLDFRKIAE
jgi:hypothetical protein